jgi:hypothetical protein
MVITEDGASSRERGYVQIISSAIKMAPHPELNSIELVPGATLVERTRQVGEAGEMARQLVDTNPGSCLGRQLERVSFIEWSTPRAPTETSTRKPTRLARYTTVVLPSTPGPGLRRFESRPLHRCLGVRCHRRQKSTPANVSSHPCRSTSSQSDD